MKLTIDTEKITLTDVLLFLKQYEVSQTIPTPEPEPEVEPPVNEPVSKIEDFVDAYYNVSGIVDDGSKIIGITAKKGGHYLPYVGLAKPTIARPYLLNNEIVFTNQPDSRFSVQPRDNSKPYELPEEYTIIFRKMPGTDWETIWNSWGDYYLGFGAGKIRVLTNGTYSSAPYPQDFELTMLHVLVENGKCTIWLNGEKAGEATGTTWRRMAYTVGTYTNSADYNWQATMYIERRMTDAEREEYFKAVKSKYAIGTILDLPYASNIRITNSGGRLTASYKYNGSEAEDKSKVQYQWWKQQPDLSKQVVIGTGASIPTQKPVKVCVKVTDVQGRSWMFISGTYFEG